VLSQRVPSRSKMMLSYWSFSVLSIFAIYAAKIEVYF
jgi:hypothetical protein